jgi:hypothetical protein
LHCPKCKQIAVVFDPYVALSLPLIRPKEIAINVTFVPKEFTGQRLNLVISIIAGASIETVSSVISERVGRPVRVIVGYSNLYGDFTWDLQETYVTTFFAFEIDNTDLFHIPCVVKMNVIRSYSRYEAGQTKEVTYSTPTQVSGPFLLSFDHQKPTEVEIADRAAEYFSFLWAETTDTFSEEVLALAKTVELPKTIVDGGKRFRVTGLAISKHVPTINLPPHAKFPFVTSRLLSLELSSAFIEGLSVPSLLRHYRPPAVRASAQPSVGAISLEKCFDFFSLPEVLDEHNQWFCPVCREHVCATKVMQVWSVPECLIVHFKRFTSTKKIDALVEFPRVLDMSKYVVGPRTEKLEYGLYGVSEHMGGLHGGHYTAHALVQRGDAPGKWYAFNDSSASVASEESAHSAAAYVVFYQRIRESSAPVPEE